VIERLSVSNEGEPRYLDYLLTMRWRSLTAAPSALNSWLGPNFLALCYFPGFVAWEFVCPSSSLEAGHQSSLYCEVAGMLLQKQS